MSEKGGFGEGELLSSEDKMFFFFKTRRIWFIKMASRLE